MTDKQTKEDAKKGESENLAATEVINLVKGLFEKINTDETLHEKIRQTLSNLQGPYLKFAQATPNLFAIENHQARIFLTNAQKTSNKWDMDTDPKYTYIKKLESIVNTIINLKTYDNNVFIKAENDLEKQISRIQKRLDIKLKREKEKSTGLKKISMAKHNTKNILIEKMTGKKIPLFAKEILLSEWFNVLVLLNLRFTTNSDKYQAKLNFVDQLIHYSQNNTQNVMTEDQLNKLAESYKKGLLLVAFNPTDSEKKHIEFRENLININLSNTTSKPPESKQEKPSIIKTDANESVISDNSSNREKHINPTDVLKISKFKKLSKSHATKQNLIKPSTTLQTKQLKNDYNKIVSSLAKGTWFEFSSENGLFIKAKLSWISPISEKYLFVDSNGIKLSDKTKLEMIEGIKNKSIRILNTFT